MATGCETCAWRKKYDTQPKSILGRLWRWHIGWCPGWKKYNAELSKEEREKLAERYNYKLK